MVVSTIPASFDTELTGGQLNYSNAKGIDASEIIVDGDGFITPMTTTGPEELVTEKLVILLIYKYIQTRRRFSNIPN